MLYKPDEFTGDVPESTLPHQYSFMVAQRCLVSSVAGMVFASSNWGAKIGAVNTTTARRSGIYK